MRPNEWRLQRIRSPHGGYVYLQDKNGRDVTCEVPTADCVCK
jgi:hypothetical protein